MLNFTNQHHQRLPQFSLLGERHPHQVIKSNCKFRIDSTRKKIYSLGNNTWLVYSIATIATNQVCPKAGTLSPLTIKSGQCITVKAGCNIPTMDHLISDDDSEDMEIVNSWLYWTRSLSQLFNHADNAQPTAMITDIRKHINGDFDASQLLKRLDNVQKQFSADHWRFSSPAVSNQSGHTHSCGFV
jgi:hypothetical protein